MVVCHASDFVFAEYSKKLYCIICMAKSSPKVAIDVSDVSNVHARY